MKVLSLFLGSACLVGAWMVRAEPNMDQQPIGLARPTGGVAFTCGPRGRTSWATVEWSGDACGEGRAVRHFHLIGDGKARRYYFDGARCTSFGGNHWSESERRNWHGPIRRFAVRDAHTGKTVEIRDLVFTDTRPDIPGELCLSATEVPLAFNRVGRAFPVEIGLFNPGTRAVKGARCDVAGLPPGVVLVDPDRAGTVVELPGWGSALHRIALKADRVTTFTLHAAFSGGDIPRMEIDVPVTVGPSLGLPRAEGYIPQPKPLVAGRYEIGAFYFQDWVRPEHWMKIWRVDPKRKPALGWYDNLNPEVLDWQIKWAVENGISFFLVDWYGRKGGRSPDYFERAFAKARFRQYIKWALLWCNHTKPGTCREEVWDGLVDYWIDQCFSMPEYMQVNGMPCVSIWNPDHLDRDNGGTGGCRRLLEKARAKARAAGYKGIFFQAMNNEDGDADKAVATQRRRCEQGIDETTQYHYLGTGGRRLVGKRGAYADVVASSAHHWEALCGVPDIRHLPNLSTGWDDHPWNDGRAFEGKDVARFRELCEAAKRFGEKTGVRRFCLAPLNEWGEGSYAEPNAEFGFGLYEAIRETFFEQPSEGWPLNYTPSDVGRGPYPVRDSEGVVPQSGGRMWR